MKEMLHYFGNGFLFGVGSFFGAAVVAFFVACRRNSFGKEQKEYNAKVLAALEDKIEAIYAVEKAIREKNERT